MVQDSYVSTWLNYGAESKFAFILEPFVRKWVSLTISVLAVPPFMALSL